MTNLARDGELTNSQIVATYCEKTSRSRDLARRASRLFPSGITHDSRRQLPYAIYVERADGSRKWDVDGNEYVDYYGGHGALILGHGHPEVIAAVQGQVARGTHFGACHEQEIRWGALVQTMVPSAELVRFTSSGTEANLLALRLARAFTGRSQIVRMKRHFHGWHDHAAFGVANHFDGTPSPGVLEDIARSTILAPPDDIPQLQQMIEGCSDLAAIILEPTGASWGQCPISPSVLHLLRDITSRRGIILIFDEVVTGFRVSPGGAQAHFGVTPDLTSLAKILAGGLPGGAICGRADLLELLDFDSAVANGFEKIGHQGTYNANPLSAAAGIAALQIIRDGEACNIATTQAEKLRKMCNDVISDEGVHWACYGAFSGFYFFLNPRNIRLDPITFDPLSLDDDALTEKSPIADRFRLAMLNHGVDIAGKPGGSVSAAHTDDDLLHTAEALRAAIRSLRNEGAVLPR